MADDNQPQKVIWQSKTVWANLLLAASAFYPPANDWISAHGTVFSIGVMFLNVALRSVSSHKLVWDWDL